MNGKRLATTLVLLLLSAAFVPLRGEDADADRKRFEEIRASAENGELSAQETLAHFYLNGSGTARDCERARRWLRKAADGGRTSSQTQLAMWLWLGHPLRDSSPEARIPESPAEAALWFLRAAEKGDEFASFTIGTMFARGEGVKQDFVQAYKWFSVAANSSTQEDADLLTPWGLGIFQPTRLSTAELASQARDRMALRMTPQQIDEAQRLAREFRPSKAPERSAPV